MKNLLYIGNKLSGKGLTTTVIETLSAQLTGEGYTITSVSAFRNPFFRMLDMLFGVVKHRKTSYVLIDTYSTSGFWFAFAVSQLCRLLNKKYIPILHGGNLPVRLKNNPKLCSMLFSNAYRNVAPSYYLLDAFEKVGFSNLVFIPNTLEIDNYPYLERAEFKPKLLWVRSFSKIYNPKMAIDVLFELKKNHPNASLCMVGPEKDGSKEVCQKYALEKNCDVLFTGKLSKDEWVALSEEYDVFINTTHLDNTPVSVMEAMTLGLPVVTTNVGGIPYLLEDGVTGLLVNDNDAEGMVKAIQRLLSDSDLTQCIVRNARKKAESWDWNVVKKQWKILLD
jgi:L-malate glycosyltransferase